MSATVEMSLLIAYLVAKILNVFVLFFLYCIQMVSKPLNPLPPVPQLIQVSAFSISTPKLLNATGENNLGNLQIYGLPLLYFLLQSVLILILHKHYFKLQHCLKILTPPNPVLSLPCHLSYQQMIPGFCSTGRLEVIGQEYLHFSLYPLLLLFKIFPLLLDPFLYSFLTRYEDLCTIDPVSLPSSFSTSSCPSAFKQAQTSHILKILTFPLSYTVFIIAEHPLFFMYSCYFFISSFYSLLCRIDFQLN